MNRQIVFVLILASTIWSNLTNAQSDTTNKINDTANIDTFYKVDQPALFPGGVAGFNNYLAKNINYPNEAKLLGIEGIVEVQFVLEATGEVRQGSVKVIKGIHPLCDNEAIRLITQSPKWIPAFDTKLNKNVAQANIYPIRFVLKKKSR